MWVNFLPFKIVIKSPWIINPTPIVQLSISFAIPNCKTINNRRPHSPEQLPHARKKLFPNTLERYGSADENERLPGQKRNTFQNNIKNNNHFKKVGNTISIRHTQTKKEKIQIITLSGTGPHCRICIVRRQIQLSPVSRTYYPFVTSAPRGTWLHSRSCCWSPIFCLPSLSAPVTRVQNGVT